MIVNANSIVEHVIQIKNGIIKQVNVNVKIIISMKKVIVGILAYVFAKIVKYLKSVTDTSVTKHDEIVIFMDIVSTKKTNTIATNVTSTASINCLKKSKKLLYFEYGFTNDHITIDNCYYLPLLCKTKGYNIKWKIMNLKKFALKMVCVIISMT